MRLLIPSVALLCIATACGRAHDVPDAFRWEEEVAPGSTIHLSTVSGQIDVTAVDGRFARVAGSTHWVGRGDPVHFAWTRQGSDIYVCALWTKDDADCTTGRYLRSKSSWLNMFSLFKRRPTNVVASLRLAIPAGVKVDVRATNGRITLQGVTGGITAHALNGTINIAQSSGPVEAKGTNANITVGLDSLGPADSVSLESVNGNMTALLPADLEGDVDLRTVNGRVRTDFPISMSGEVSRHSVHGQIGGSSRRVLLHTINGNVSLLKQPGTPRQKETAELGARHLKS